MLLSHRPGSDDSVLLTDRQEEGLTAEQEKNLTRCTDHTQISNQICNILQYFDIKPLSKGPLC